MRNKFVVVTHAVLSGSEDIAGPAHNIVSYLDRKKAEYLFIRHSLFAGDQTLLSSRKGGKVSSSRLNSSLRFGEIVNRVSEGYRTVKSVSQFSKKKPSVYIGIDPLNSFWGLVLKKMGKVNTLISFTVDYSPNRFQSRLLNKIYHLIDRVTLRFSDKAWVVSKRIYDLRLAQGKNPRDIVLVPNAPGVSEVKSLIKKNADSMNIITIGTISSAINFKVVIDSIGEVRKSFPNVKLTIIGQGQGMMDLEKEIEKLGLTQNVFLVGSKTHDEVFKILSSQGIGIAMYTDDAPWSYYSDSMKARDYLALGLPVIISGNIGTVDEIMNEKAGILIKNEKEDLVKAIERLLRDKIYYEELRKNALRLAKENDIEKILDKALREESFQ